MRVVTKHSLKHNVLSLAIAQALLCSASNINAETITVDVTTDNGGTGCELGEAITSANNDNAASNGCVTGSGVDEIVFDNTLSGSTITFASQKGVNESVTIDGDLDNDGIPDIEISGGDSIRLFRAAPGTSTKTFTFEGLTLSGGKTTSGNGSAIWCQTGYANQLCNVTISNSVITGNSTFDGGAVAGTIDSHFTIINSTLSNNQAKRGAAVFTYQASSSVTLINSTLSGNTATSSGGGIYSYGGGDITLTNSTISGNTASSGKGAGIASYYGGDIDLTNTTISHNTGSGVYASSVASFNVTNSILANNSNSDCTGNSTVDIDIKNLVEDGGAGCGMSPLLTVDPELAALADNGGTTQTHLPASTSPVIDAGDNSNCGTGLTVTTDQRDIDRDDGSCDIGAVEYVAASLQWDSATASVAENDESLTLTVNRTGSPIGEVSVDYASTIGTATSPADFTGNSGTFTFASGITSQTVTIDITNDSEVESDENFTVTLSNAQVVSVADSIALGANTVSTVTITDTDTDTVSSSGSGGGSITPWFLLLGFVTWLRRNI
ncbi:MAG: hypothetical protein GY777_27520 [Candidatus Brocadiaceae bacterium]|nr:hypothetical protein [Candidatus Brocadiaceae bacterium]